MLQHPVNTMGGISPPTFGLLAIINYSYPIVRARPLRTIYAASTTLHAHDLPSLPSVQRSALSSKNRIFGHCAFLYPNFLRANTAKDLCQKSLVKSSSSFLPACTVGIASFTPGFLFTCRYPLRKIDIGFSCMTRRVA